MLTSQQLSLLGYVYDGILQGQPQWDVRWHIEDPPVSITTVMVVIATVMSVSTRMQGGMLKTSPVLFVGYGPCFTEDSPNLLINSLLRICSAGNTWKH